MLIDALVDAVLLLCLAAPAGVAVAWLSSRGADALAGAFRGDRGLGWPRGVKEEDPPSWNWERPVPQAAGPSNASPSMPADTPAPVAALSRRLRVRVQAGTSRRRRDG